MFFSDAVIWKYFWLFWLFGLIELIGTMPTFLQGLKQTFCLPYIYISHGFHLPDKSNYQPAVQYSLPFNEQWIALNGGTDKKNSHSWDVLTQRYAYDFVILDEHGQSFAGDKTLLQSYYCYGKAVLAPADGVVLEVTDKYPNARTYGNGRVDPTVKDIRGNYIIIKHAEKEYSFIAHLLPQSVKVKAGQIVKRGEPVAQCGNSGNTSEPHIHFHVQDGKSFFTSAGLPIRFRGVQAKQARNNDDLCCKASPETNNEKEVSSIQRGDLVSNIKTSLKKALGAVDTCNSNVESAK
jgi:hypothetical protein